MEQRTAEQLANLLTEEADFRRHIADYHGSSRRGGWMPEIMHHNRDRSEELRDIAGQLRNGDNPDLNDARDVFESLTYYADRLLNANTLSDQADAVKHLTDALSDAKTWLPSVWNDRGEWIEDV